MDMDVACGRHGIIPPLQGSSKSLSTWLDLPWQCPQAVAGIDAPGASKPSTYQERACASPSLVNLCFMYAKEDPPTAIGMFPHVYSWCEDERYLPPQMF